MYYNNVGYARERLRNGIVDTTKGPAYVRDVMSSGSKQKNRNPFDGEPVAPQEPFDGWVRVAIDLDNPVQDNNGILVSISYLNNTDSSDIINISEVSPIPVKLGWVNYDGTSVYVSRMPVRAFKQSLTVDNLAFLEYKHRFGAFPYKDMHNTIVGNYPSFKECSAKVVKNRSKLAFSREFALDSSGNLYYSGRVVGDWDGVKFNFMSQDKYLEKRLVGVV